MKTKHIIILITLVITVPVLSTIGFSLATYYFARSQAMEQYRDISEITVTNAPGPMDSFNFKDEIHGELQGGGKIQLKLSLGFSQNNQKLSGELSSRRTQLRNIVKLILAGKSKSELSRVEGQLKLRKEIKSSINHILSEGKITEVYFREFMVR